MSKKHKCQKHVAYSGFVEKNFDVGKIILSFELLVLFLVSLHYSHGYYTKTDLGDADYREISIKTCFGEKPWI